MRLLAVDLLWKNADLWPEYGEYYGISGGSGKFGHD